MVVIKNDAAPISLRGVTGSHVHGAVDYVARVRPDATHLLPLLGIRDWADPPPELIPARDYLSFIDQAAAWIGDPLFGLHLGATMRVDDLFGYGFLLCACRTSREAIEQTIRFEKLTHDLGHTEVVVEGDVARYRFVSHCPGFAGERHYMEASIAAIRATADWLARMTLPVFEFTLPHALPEAADIEEYRRVLKGPVQFGGLHAEARIPAALLDMPLPGGSASLFESLEKIALQQLEALNNSTENELVKSVKLLINKHLGFGRANSETVARALGLSVRTLNRRLAGEGETLSGLVAGIRREMAMRYVNEGALALTEVAFLLGYSEQASFNHAFRQWFGMSPTQWRLQRDR